MGNETLLFEAPSCYERHINPVVLAAFAVIQWCSYIAFSISAERRPLLDIGLPQSSPRRSVLCCPHIAASRDLHQIVGPPCGLPTLRLPVRGRHSRTFPPQRPSVLLAMCRAHCHLRSAIRRTMSVTLVLLRISSFLIRSRKETPSIALSIALCVTLILLFPHTWKIPKKRLIISENSFKRRIEKRNKIISIKKFDVLCGVRNKIK
jgi:hypothetical protein